MIEAVIFDVDGTLVDTVDLHARAWHETLRDFGFDVPYDDVRAQIGKGGDQLLPVFVPEPALSQHREAIEQHRGALYKKHFLPQAKAFPDVRALFEKLRSMGYDLALASSAHGDELEYYKKLAHIEDLVDEATHKDDVDKSKPHPDIFEAALDQLGCEPGDAIVIGDTPWDAIAAGKAGLATIGMLCGGFAEADLRAAGAKWIYRDPAHLLRELDRSPLARPARSTTAESRPSPDPRG